MIERADVLLCQRLRVLMRKAAGRVSCTCPVVCVLCLRTWPQSACEVRAHIIDKDSLDTPTRERPGHTHRHGKEGCTPLQALH